MYAELDTLGKRVKYFREQKKLSQAQLANMVLAKDKNTGELSMSREQIANLAAKHGFDVKAGVSKKLHYLIVGTHDVSLLAGHDKSSKHRKAEDLIAQGIKIQIITERDFIKIIQM